MPIDTKLAGDGPATLRVQALTPISGLEADDRVVDIDPRRDGRRSGMDEARKAGPGIRQLTAALPDSSFDEIVESLRKVWVVPEPPHPPACGRVSGDA